MTPPIVSRADWGARDPVRPLTPYGPNGLGLTLHWEGPPLGAYAASDATGILRAIQLAHQNNTSENYADIAYNWVIDRFGIIYEARGFARSGANGGSLANSSDYAVCFMMGQGDPFPDVCKQSFIQLRAWLMSQGVSNGVSAHHDWVATACPGPEITAFARQLDGQSDVIPEVVPDMVESDFQRLNQLMAGHTDDLAGALGKQLGQVAQLLQQTNAKLDQLVSAKGTVNVPPSLTYVLKQ